MSEPLLRLQLVIHLQESAAAWARRTRRNGQQVTIYAERCSEIMYDLDQSLRVERSPTDVEYLQDLMAVSRLEVIMLKLHPTIVEEAGCSSPTPETCNSWDRNHGNIEGVLHELYHEPFRAPPEPWEDDLDNAVKFDEWTWMARLLDMINASASAQVEERTSLIRDICSLETEFWASNQNTRAFAIASLISAVATTGKMDHLITSEPGNESQLIIFLKKALNVLSDPDADSRSFQLSQDAQGRSAIPGTSGLRFSDSSDKVPMCGCLNRGQKPKRHWETACPENPAIKKRTCELCHKEFAAGRNDNYQRHRKDQHGLTD